MKTITFDQAKKFLEANYKYDRLYGRGKEYGDVVVNSEIERARNLQEGELDFLLISRHEHVTGKTVSYGVNHILTGKLITEESQPRKEGQSYSDWVKSLNVI